jgi:hypothetical protein
LPSNLQSNLHLTTSLYSPLIIGWTATTQSLIYKTTTWVWTTGADHIFQVGNNGATEAMRITNAWNIAIGISNTAYKTEIYSATSATGLGVSCAAALWAGSGWGITAYTPNIPTAVDQRIGILLFW